MKKLLLTLLALLLCLPAMAEEPARSVEGNYLYSLTYGGAILTDYIPESGDIGSDDMAVLPAEIAGHPVVMYGFVFEEFAPLEKIIVQEGVTDFGDAFCWSWFDGEIVLPASLNYIAEGGLYGVRAEITVHEDNPFFTCEDGFLIDTRTGTLLYTAPSAADKPLPAVRRLGSSCLDNWHAGETVVLPETLTSIGGGVFYDLVDTKHVNIPAGVTQIGAGAFNCTGLTEVTLPAGLTAIEGLTFSCNWFTEIVIPEGVERIESWAFYLCPLTRVEIPASCTFVAWDAFDPEVELVLLGENTHVETMEEFDQSRWEDENEGAIIQGEWAYVVTDWGMIVTGWLYGDTVPETVEIPAILGGEPVVGIGRNALNTSSMPGKTRFTLIIPEGVRFLETDALQCCHNADRLVLPSTLVDIPEGISPHLYAEITLAEGNPRYELREGYLIDTRTDTLIYTCMSAPEDRLPAVRRIGDDALANYGSLTSEGSLWSGDLVIPEGVEALGCNIAYDDPFLKSVTLPESLRVIESGAFECIIVASGEIVVPAGVEVIEFGAFGLYTPIEAEVIVTSPDTRIETAREYAIRTGETWVLEDDWMPTDFTFAWE